MKGTVEASTVNHGLRKRVIVAKVRRGIRRLFWNSEELACWLEVDSFVPLRGDGRWCLSLLLWRVKEHLLFSAPCWASAVVAASWLLGSKEFADGPYSPRWLVLLGAVSARTGGVLRDREEFSSWHYVGDRIADGCGWRKRLQNSGWTDSWWIRRHGPFSASEGCS